MPSTSLSDRVWSVPWAIGLSLGGWFTALFCVGVVNGQTPLDPGGRALLMCLAGLGFLVGMQLPTLGLLRGRTPAELRSLTPVVASLWTVAGTALVAFAAAADSMATGGPEPRWHFLTASLCAIITAVTTWSVMLVRAPRPAPPVEQPFDGLARHLDGFSSDADQASGFRHGLTVELAFERGERGLDVDLRGLIRLPDGERLMSEVPSDELGLAAVEGEVRLTERALAGRWLRRARPSADVVTTWCLRLLDEAQARRTGVDDAEAWLWRTAERGAPTALFALAEKHPGSPRVTQLAEEFVRRGDPGRQLVGAQVLGAAALAARVDDPAVSDAWRARALDAWADATPPEPDALRRWAERPGLRAAVAAVAARSAEPQVEIASSALDHLPGRLGPDDSARVTRALQALVALDPPGLEATTLRLFEAVQSLEGEAARTLAVIGGPDAVAALRRRLETFAVMDGARQQVVEQALARLLDRLRDRLGGEVVGGLSPAGLPAGQLSVADEGDRG